jgi:hypothetical protein
MNIKNITETELRASVSNNEDLLIIAIEDDPPGLLGLKKGDEVPATGYRSISSVRYGSMRFIYVQRIEDIPITHRLIRQSESPFRRALEGYVERDIDELIRHLPPLERDGRYWRYEGGLCKLFIRSRPPGKEVVDAILWKEFISLPNHLNLVPIQLIPPYVAPRREELEFDYYEGFESGGLDGWFGR